MNINKMRKLFIVAVFFLATISCDRIEKTSNEVYTIESFEMAYSSIKFHNDVFFSDINFRVMEKPELKEMLKNEKLNLIESFSGDLDKYIDSYDGNNQELRNRLNYFTESLIEVTENKEWIDSLTNKIGFFESVKALEKNSEEKDYYSKKLKLDNQLLVFNVVQDLYKDINIH